MDFSTILLLFVLVAAAPALIEGAVVIIAVVFGILTKGLSLGLSSAVSASRAKTEREVMLSGASYGAAMIYAAAFEMALVPAEWRAWTRLGLVVVGVPLLMIALDWRSRGPRDGKLAALYLVKIGIAVALLYLLRQPTPHWLASFENAYRLSVKLLATWSLITGAFKLALVLRGMPREREPEIVAQGAYGDAKVTTRKRE